jgi:putative transposase
MTISFVRHQLQPAVVRHAIWLYMRFTLSYRDAKICLQSAVRISPTKRITMGIEVRAVVRPRTSRQTPRPTSRWCGPAVLAWAVDDEGEALDLLVQRRRDKAAAVKLMRKLLKKQGYAPDVLVTDKLRSYGTAKSEIGLSARHDQGLRYTTARA